MTTATYRDRPDWTSTITYHTGYVETFKHCGRCMAIIPRKTCDHCEKDAAKEAERKAAFQQFLASKKRG